MAVVLDVGLSEGAKVCSLDGLAVGVPDVGESVGLTVGGTEVCAVVGFAVRIIEVAMPDGCDEGGIEGSADDSVSGEVVEIAAVTLVGGLGAALGEVVAAVTLVGGPITTPSLSVAVLFWLLLFLKEIIKPVAEAAIMIATTISQRSRFRFVSSALFIFSDDGASNCSSSSSVSYDNWASLSFSIFLRSKSILGLKCEIIRHY